MAGLTVVAEPPKQEKNRGGRPKGRFKLLLTPDDLKKVETLAGYGLNQPEVATVMGISERTLSEYKGKSAEFSAAWSRGKEKAKAYVAGKLMAKIEEGDMSAIRWYEQTRCGRSEKVVTENAVTHNIQSLESYLREQEKNVTSPTTAIPGTDYTQGIQNSIEGNILSAEGHTGLLQSPSENIEADNSAAALTNSNTN